GRPAPLSSPRARDSNRPLGGEGGARVPEARMFVPARSRCPAPDSTSSSRAKAGTSFGPEEPVAGAAAAARVGAMAAVAVGEAAVAAPAASRIGARATVAIGDALLLVHRLDLHHPPAAAPAIDRVGAARVVPVGDAADATAAVHR